MNYFFKSAVTGAFLLASLAVNAQDLARKIPADAMAVVTVKGGNLTQLLAIKDFDTTYIGKKILGKLSKEVKGPVNSIDELGFNFSSSFYYYNQTNDSVSYNCFLFPVKNAARVDKLFLGTDKQFKQEGKMRSFHETDGKSAIYWNEELFLFVIGEGRTNYFSRPEIRKQLGLSAQTYDELAVDSTVVLTDTTATVMSPEDIVTTDYENHQPAAKSKIKKSSGKKATAHKTKAKSKAATRTRKKTANKKPLKKKAVKAIEYSPDMEGISDSVVVDTAYADYQYIDSAVLHDEKIKNALVARWTSNMINEFFSSERKTSILNNNDFAKSADDKAEAIIWISGADKLMNTFLPSLPTFKYFNMLKGFGSANGKLYLEDKAIRMSASVTVSDEMAASAKRINKRKLNKEFLKYINDEQLIGYIAYAKDTKAYLQEYPKIMSRLYGSLYSDEIDMAADLFNLLLDEEAISKVIKGDALFVFNGLSQKEVSYKSYDYNEDNFESTEVMKTRKETMPEFLLMVSTEDTRLLNKLIAYGVKKEVVKNNQKFYEISGSKMPISLYFTIKNGIIFLGTNATEMEQIVGNTYRGSLSAKHKKALSGANYAGYFSPKRLSGKIPAELIGSKDTMAKTNKTLSNLGDIYMKSNSANGNTFSAEVSMDTPADQKNALKYLFSIIEGARK